jgi:thiosulfate dehydrogenase
MPRLHSRLLVLAAVVALAACAANTQTAQPGAAPSQQLYDPQALPSGPAGDSIRLGHDVMEHTQKYLPKNVTAGMSCTACHVAGGTAKRGGSFIGVYGRFPQWNKRAKRMIALQDRLAECFLYSMNGTPPAYSSKEMVAMVAYIAYLSRNVPVGTPQAADDRFVVPLPSASPNVAHGAALYAQKCSSCHGAGGAGVAGTFPPLWGAKSFNSGAGMAHIDRMAGFVRYNMPQNAPGTLSMNDSYDVAAYVLTHERPRFRKSRAIQFAPVRATYF